MLMKKTNAPKTYQEIEALINKGGNKVWDSYVRFLEQEIQKKYNPKKAE